LRSVRCSLFVTADEPNCNLLCPVQQHRSQYEHFSFDCGKNSAYESQQGRQQAMRASLDTRQELEANSAGYGVCRNCVSIKRLETGHRSSARTNRIEANVSSAFTAQLRAAFSPGPQYSTRRRPMMVRGCCYYMQRLTFVRRRQQCKLRVLLRGEYLRMHSIGVRLTQIAQTGWS
jgi:hypothetical protein